MDRDFKQAAEMNPSDTIIITARAGVGGMRMSPLKMELLTNVSKTRREV